MSTRWCARLRRWRACELAGLEEMPVIIRDIDDDTATVIMVDTNIQREDILPSEKAFAYKMKYEALKHQGSKGEKYTAEMVGETAGDSGRTVQRYIRLANLISGLLDLVDVKKVPMIVGEKLSYLTREEQELVLEAVRNCEIMPTAAQAEAIKMFSEEKKLDGNAIYGLLLKKKNSGNGVTISAKKISSYFPPAYTKQEIENVIYTLLEEWKNGREEELEHGEDTI